MQIECPDFLHTLVLTKHKFGSDWDLAPSVLRALNTWSTWTSKSGCPFFQEYTDHGPEHISGVLNTCVGLLSKHARGVLTPTDAGILILAVLLHDCAMHLQPDGFVRVVRDEYLAAPIVTLDTAPWSVLWEQFRSRMARADRRELRRIFGSDEPIAAPDLNTPSKWTAEQHAYIGEFIRQHHPRLAHEIALRGVPGPSQDSQIRIELASEDARGLAGLVARSHGMPIRGSLDSLKEHYAIREFCGVHPPYLMALLRIADYLQIEPGRAPEELLKVKTLRSPLSRREWSVHHAIRDIRWNHPDPEAVYIALHASKTDLHTLLRLQDWLTGIQTELDASWAILGEVYGEANKNDLQQLGLTLRRVRSDLDVASSFERKLNYYPIKGEFGVETAEMLHLLIEPLYGGDKTIGIRELIQNASDAIRELERHCADAGVPMDSLERIAQEADIIVRHESAESGSTEPCWVTTVSDRGIGMSLETVTKYFLRAGASFRKSDAWKQQFQDERGESKIIRSGRFGVGALAAFLLGDTLELRTRHVNSPREDGIRFVASLTDNAFVLYRERLPVGTSIRVSGKHQIPYKRWYFMRKPSLAVHWPDHPDSLHQSDVSPAPELDSAVPDLWRRIVTPNCDSVDWSLHAGQHSGVLCNGIHIPHTLRSLRIASWCDIHSPRISIGDPSGRLNINLQRSRIDGQLPFLEELTIDVARDVLARLLLAPEALDSGTLSSGVALTTPQGILDAFDDESLLRVAARKSRNWPIGFSDMGFSVGKALFENRGDSSLRIVYSSESSYSIRDLLGIFNCDWVHLVNRLLPSAYVSLFGSDHKSSMVSESVHGALWPSTVVSGLRILAPTRFLRSYRGHRGEKKGVVPDPRVRRRNRTFVLLEIGSPGESKADWGRFFLGSWKKHDEYCCVEMHCTLKANSAPDPIEASCFDELWQRHLGQRYIPYAMKERVILLAQVAQDPTMRDHIEQQKRLMSASREQG